LKDMPKILERLKHFDNYVKFHHKGEV